MSGISPGLSGSSVPRKSVRIAAREVDGKAVVVVLDARKLHTLNAVGTRVFALCDGVRDVSAIASQIAVEFDVDDGIAERDVLAFLMRLIAEGAVEVVSAGGSR